VNRHRAESSACTAEILANIRVAARARPPDNRPDRDGTKFPFLFGRIRIAAWAVAGAVDRSLPKRRSFLLMSRSLATSRFRDLGTVIVSSPSMHPTPSRYRPWRTGRHRRSSLSAERPVPLHFDYLLTTVHDNHRGNCSPRTGATRSTIVHFTQAAALERAQALMSINMATRGGEGPDRRADRQFPIPLTSGFRPKILFAPGSAHGIGVHHAGMLPPNNPPAGGTVWAQAGLLKSRCAGTGTTLVCRDQRCRFRTVMLPALSKYDGTRTRLLNGPRVYPPDRRAAARAGAGYATTIAT